MNDPSTNKFFLWKLSISKGFPLLERSLYEDLLYICLYYGKRISRKRKKKFSEPQLNRLHAYQIRFHNYTSCRITKECGNRNRNPYIQSNQRKTEGNLGGTIVAGNMDGGERSEGED